MRLDRILLSASLILSAPLWAGSSSDSDESSDVIPRARANSHPLSASQEGLLSRSITPVFVLHSLSEILESGEHKDHQGKNWRLLTPQKELPSLEGEMEARFSASYRKDGRQFRKFNLGIKNGDTFTPTGHTLTFQQE